MPVISTFYGIIVLMYFFDNKRHKKPHVHVRYQDDEAVISIPDGKILAGKLPPGKMKILSAWIEIHRDELLANWQLAVAGEQVAKIEPLK